jgi:hypothetical protein
MVVKIRHVLDPGVLEGHFARVLMWPPHQLVGVIGGRERRDLPDREPLHLQLLNDLFGRHPFAELRASAPAT